VSTLLGKMTNWTLLWLEIIKNKDDGEWHLYDRGTRSERYHATYCFHDMGYLVITGWLLLYLARTGRPQYPWSDRLGRCMGFLWIISFVLVEAVAATMVE
jgi:hypothetical protein